LKPGAALIHKVGLLLVLCAMFLSPGLSHAEQAVAAGQSSGELEVGHGEARKPNQLAVFAGITGESRRDYAPTLALEYVRHVNESFAVAAVAEYAFGDLDYFIFVVPFAWVNDSLKVFAGPGFEVEEKGETKLLLRAGFEYGFELNEHWELAPQFNVDFVDGEYATVIGISVGRGF